MRILLQNCKNHFYYRADGAWTPHPDEALDFESSVRALDFCRLHRPSNVQIILKFPNDRYDIDFPVSEACKKTSAARAD
jgi:hypothetical protein